MILSWKTDVQPFLGEFSGPITSSVDPWSENESAVFCKTRVARA